MWVLHVVGWLEDTRITHAFKSILILLLCPIQRFLFCCHQVLAFIVAGMLEGAIIPHVFKSAFLLNPLYCNFSDHITFII